MRHLHWIRCVRAEMEQKHRCAFCEVTSMPEMPTTLTSLVQMKNSEICCHNNASHSQSAVALCSGMRIQKLHRDNIHPGLKSLCGWHQEHSQSEPTGKHVRSQAERLSTAFSTRSEAVNFAFSEMIIVPVGPCPRKICRCIFVWIYCDADVRDKAKTCLEESLSTFINRSLHPRQRGNNFRHKVTSINFAFSEQTIVLIGQTVQYKYQSTDKCIQFFKVELK